MCTIQRTHFDFVFTWIIKYFALCMKIIAIVTMFLLSLFWEVIPLFLENCLPTGRVYSHKTQLIPVESTKNCIKYQTINNKVNSGICNIQWEALSFYKDTISHKLHMLRVKPIDKFEIIQLVMHKTLCLLQLPMS